MLVSSERRDHDDRDRKAAGCQQSLEVEAVDAGHVNIRDDAIV